MWWTIFVRNGGKAHIDQLLLTNLNYEWQGHRPAHKTFLPVTPGAARAKRNNLLRLSLSYR
jgi:hypothetical protein